MYYLIIFNKTKYTLKLNTTPAFWAPYNNCARTLLAIKIYLQQ